MFSQLISERRHTVLVCLTLAFLAAALLPIPAHAQARIVRQSETVRLRLSESDSMLQGVVTMQPGTWHLALADGGTAAVATRSLRSVEVLALRRRTARGALIGGLAGAALGAAIWFSASDDDNCEGDGAVVCDVLLDPIIDSAIAAAAVLVTAGGVGIGALIGSRMKAPRWVPAELPRDPPAQEIPPALSVGLSLRRSTSR